MLLKKGSQEWTVALIIVRYANQCGMDEDFNIIIPDALVLTLNSDEKLEDCFEEESKTSSEEESDEETLRRIE